ncbi:hypothetical protein [Novosphingobium malaysiense]|uniref:Uncharacterized protein n=1 Tax=Novosphingobium malaysiense TaxID=1348853 RepID=A0A0B1ZJZ6_9SPHN|nr:hypothetical protein [Novosphingobium malaysiense]KHK90896.1 hypothetical protein LK12_08020 [Novosphingobium malaysiense]
MEERLPLSGKRWIWILAGLLVLIVLGTIVSSVRASSSNSVVASESTGQNEGMAVVPAHPADSAAYKAETADEHD